MKKFWDFIKTTLIIFLIWRIALFAASYAGTKIIPKYGNMYPYANTALEPTMLPSWVWSFGGFDGVHYLRIAQNGYSDAYYQAFFPLYPVLIRFLNILPKDFSLNTGVFVDRSYFHLAIILSNIFLLASLFLLKKVTGKKSFLWNSLLMLSFPTAYYFGAIYTESLFLLQLLLFLYFFRKEKYIWAGIVALAASVTRVTGILFFVLLLIKFFERVLRRRVVSVSLVIGLVTAPLGLAGYMFYLWKNYASPFMFMTSQPGFGAERNTLPIITLPQVFFRYVKMFATVRNEFQLFTLSNEFVFSILVLVLIIWAFKKVDFSTWLLSFLIFLTPTLTGTLSSMPRYVLFSYILLIPVINKRLGNLKVPLVGVMVIVQVIFLIMFTRGYWVA